MLYKILYDLHESFSPFNVFRYITFRSAMAAVTAAMVTIIFAPMIIRRLKKLSVKCLREDTPKRHRDEKGDIPTMGGLIIILSIFTAVLAWGDLTNQYVLLMLFALAGFGGIGFADDLMKVRGRGGMRARTKFGLQIIMALSIGLFLKANPVDEHATMLIMPFFKRMFIDLAIFYIPFAILVIVGSSNAVNLTDGMDGLAIGLVGIATLANGALVYISGHRGLAEYLNVLYLPYTAELTVFCGAMFGAALGFLWYNAYPAEVFMGDVGSLGLGGSLGTLAVISKHEIVLAVVGGIFVIETLSVVLQVASFKLTGKRIFLMAPIHHHFELKGWPEPRIIVRFWIAGIVLALLSLATLKVR